MVQTRAYDEARFARMVGRIFLAIGLVGLPFTAWLNWDVTRMYPDSWRVDWYDLMFLRFPDNALATLIIGVMILVGVVILFRARRTERILAFGVAATATVIEVIDTGTRVNHQPQLKLRLSVAAPGRELYEVTVKKVVPMLLLPRLKFGFPLSVRVDQNDRKRVVIDWSDAQEAGPAPFTGPGRTWTAGPGQSMAGPAHATRVTTPHMPDLPRLPRQPTSREDLKAQIRSVGVPGTATLTAVFPMPAVDDRRLFRMDLLVRLDNGVSYVEQNEPVPVEQEHAIKAVAGTRVPVRVAQVHGVAVTLFEWERL